MELKITPFPPMKKNRYYRTAILSLFVIIASASFNCLRSDDSEAASAYDPGRDISSDTMVAAAIVDNDWERMRIPRVAGIWKLNSVAFSNPNEGWAVGSNEDTTKGVTLHYYNGVWQKDFMPYAGKYWTVHLMDIALSGPRDGWAVGDKYYIWADPDRFKGFILRLQAGAWKVFTPPNVGRSFNFEGVATVPGTREAWAVGAVTSGRTRRGLLMKYSGRWKEVTNPKVGADWWELHDVCFPSRNKGWAVGKVVHPDSNDNPLLVLGYRNGQWTREEVPPARGLKRSLLAVAFPTPDTGWAAGEGAFLRYRNGGWEKENIPGDMDNWIIHSLTFPTPDYGWAVGWDNAGKKPLWLEKTSKGWRRVTTKWDEKLEEFNGVFFLKPNLGWAVGAMSYRGSYPGALFKYTPKAHN